MEHRCSVRKSLGFHLLLYQHGLPIQSGVCRDLGLGGLFFASADRAWRKYESLEVEILGRSGLPSMRLPVVVIHFSSCGAGLMFGVVTDAQRHRLRAWLSEWEPRDVGMATSRTRYVA